MLFFLFISPIFPSGKLGVGPPNPNFLSFLSFWLGKTHQYNVSIENNKRQSAAEKATRTPHSPRKNSIYDLISFSQCIYDLSDASWLWLCCVEHISMSGIYIRRCWIKECVAFDYENNIILFLSSDNPRLTFWLTLCLNIVSFLVQLFFLLQYVLGGFCFV